VAVEAGEPRGAERRREARPLVRRRVADVEAVLEAEEEEAVAGAVDVEAATAPLLLVGEADDGTETAAGAEVEGVDAAVHVHGARRRLRLRLRLGTGGGAAAEEADERHRGLEAVVVDGELGVGDDLEPDLANGAAAVDGPGRQVEEDVPDELLGQVRGHGSRGRRRGLLPLPRPRGALHGRQLRRRTPAGRRPRSDRSCKTPDAFDREQRSGFESPHRF